MSVKIALLLLGILCCAVVSLPNLIKSRATSNTMPCLNNLRIISSAKNQWALDHNKTDHDTPTWNDIRPYFPSRWTNGEPICPAGGTYTIGRLDENPTCSIGDHEPGHKLP